MARLSGLQREILSLYRKCLRETRKKPAVRRKAKLPSLRSVCDAPSQLLSCANTFTRSEFRAHQNHDKKDYSAIEYMLRKGQRQLETYASPGIRNIK
ncbi:hypothetical protein E4T45_14758 [Aureobasidium sp. EXF-8846]|nr:hypothetical protein E4T45_14758 [Aureobasidium sp. EXF-8846]